MGYLSRHRRLSHTRNWLAAFACTTSLSVLSLTTPADAQTDGSSARDLVTVISTTQSEIDQLNLELGDLREAVNKALVDLGDAQAAAEQARLGVESAKEALGTSQTEVETAQEGVNELARSAFRGSGSSPITHASDGDAQKDALDRGTFISQQQAEKQGTLEALEQKRTANANTESTLRAASQLADDRADEAETAQTDAQTLLDDTLELLSDKTEQRDTAQQSLEDAQAQLEEIRPGSQGTQDDWLQPPVAAPEALAEETADTNNVATVESVAEQASTAPVATEESTTEESTTDEAVSGEGTASSESELSSTAVSVIAQEVVDKAQGIDIPMPTTSQIEQAVETLEATQGAFDETDPNDLASVAGMVAATLVVLASGVDTAELAQSSSAVEEGEQESTTSAVEPSATDIALDDESAATEDGHAQPIPAVNIAPSTDDGVLSAILPSVSTVDQVSTEATGLLSDSSREATIETVIARAESQIGVPYAWGGGNANGPTQGIRDGGVADRHGDYNKVGFDCSGLTLYAFAGAGISLPHYTGYQYQRGTQIDPSQAERGDLLFWGPTGNHHVAIYLGDGMMIEAPQSGDVVKKSPVRWSSMSQYAVRLL
ncbi:NlpC/P60 family protein [Corynebacterium breve]|uniref:NlpC/P60 family protein n=1 Tax=Corynebacterium breve TaxID=3049799 RepID=A0ABY8VGR6_9CORY|nr:NlpC/P60 family protein [Corynebacterium breve]WIM68866.1 NlpC/P60 family protein [Corynebacterium breve]